MFSLERSPGEHPALGTRGRQSQRWSCSARNGTVSYNRPEETLELPREPGRTRYQERFIQWLLPSTCPFSPRHPWPDVSVLQRDKQPPAAGSLSSPLISTTGQKNPVTPSSSQAQRKANPGLRAGTGGCRNKPEPQCCGFVFISNAAPTSARFPHSGKVRATPSPSCSSGTREPRKERSSSCPGWLREPSCVRRCWARPGQMVPGSAGCQGPRPTLHLLFTNFFVTALGFRRLLPAPRAASRICRLAARL